MDSDQIISNGFDKCIRTSTQINFCSRRASVDTGIPAGTPEEVPNGHSGELRSFPNAKIYVNKDGTSIAGFSFFVFAEIV